MKEFFQGADLQLMENIDYFSSKGEKVMFKHASEGKTQANLISEYLH